MLSTHLQRTVSSRDWTHIGTIWTSKADELPVPSTIKFKFKFKQCCELLCTPRNTAPAGGAAEAVFIYIPETVIITEFQSPDTTVAL